MTALALVVYVLYPVAPPRLAIAGFQDTVSEHGPLNISSKLLQGLYNPVAAIPSLHFGYALLVGGAVAWLAHPRAMRIAGALYPVVMLFVIVATGNHYYFDAAAGAVVALAAAFVADSLVRDVPHPVLSAPEGARSSSPSRSHRSRVGTLHENPRAQTPRPGSLRCQLAERPAQPRQHARCRASRARPPAGVSTGRSLQGATTPFPP